MSPFFKKLFSPVFLAKKIVRVTYDAYWDWRFGGWCGGTKYSPYTHLGANHTQSSEYLQLKILFRHARLRIAPDDVLVDVGCGKGRVINYWLMSGYRNRMIGIEIDEDVADRTRRRLQSYPNVDILTGDAIDVLPADGTTFYLWNPFGTAVVCRFKSRLMEVHGRRGNVTVVFYNCQPEALRVFEGDPDWAVERLDEETGLAFPSAIIRMKGPADRVSPPAG